MKAKNLSYNVAKYFVENGVTYKMNVRISLGDCCKMVYVIGVSRPTFTKNVETGVSFCVLVIVVTKKY